MNMLASTFKKVEISFKESLPKAVIDYVEFLETEFVRLDNQLAAWEDHIRAGVEKFGDSPYKVLDMDEDIEFRYRFINNNREVTNLADRLLYSSAYSTGYICRTRLTMRIQFNHALYDFLKDSYNLDLSFDKSDIEDSQDFWEIIKRTLSELGGSSLQEAMLLTIKDNFHALFDARNQKLSIQKSGTILVCENLYFHSTRYDVNTLISRALELYETGFITSGLPIPKIKDGISISMPANKLTSIRSYKNRRADLVFKTSGCLREFVDLFSLTAT